MKRDSIQAQSWESSLEVRVIEKLLVYFVCEWEAGGDHQEWCFGGGALTL